MLSLKSCRKIWTFSSSLIFGSTVTTNSKQKSDLLLKPFPKDCEIRNVVFLENDTKENVDDEKELGKGRSLLIAFKIENSKKNSKNSFLKEWVRW